MGNSLRGIAAGGSQGIGVGNTTDCLVTGNVITNYTDSITDTGNATRLIAYGNRVDVAPALTSATSSGTPVRVVATANIPAASASLDGNIMIEDNGTGDRNLLVYAGGQRFRIDGGANF